MTTTDTSPAPRRRVTLRMAKLTPGEVADELAIGALLYPESATNQAQRPRTRGDCIDGPRPCPWASCRHHLALDINPSMGAIKVNHPDRELWELEHSCSLDVADAGDHVLEEVGELLGGVTRERARQIERAARRKLHDELTRSPL